MMGNTYPESLRVLDLFLFPIDIVDLRQCRDYCPLYGEKNGIHANNDVSVKKTLFNLLFGNVTVER